MAHAAVSRPAPRILGGNPVTPATAFGPMAAIVVRAALSDTGVSCGGTVIAPYAVLTAAHCFEVPTQGTPAQLMVVTGKADLAAPGGQHLDIRAIVTHPQFVHTRLLMTDDVAVVLLQTPTTAPSAIRSTSTPQLGSGT